MRCPEADILGSRHIVIFITASSGIARISNNQADEIQTQKRSVAPLSVLLSLLLSLALQFSSIGWH